MEQLYGMIGMIQSETAVSETRANKNPANRKTQTINRANNDQCYNVDTLGPLKRKLHCMEKAAWKNKAECHCA